MANLKSLAKDTAIYGMSSIIGRFLNYLLVPLYTIQMQAATGDYGIVTNLYSYIALLQVLLTFGMETAFFRFANKPGADPSRVYSTALTLVGGVGALFVLLVFVSLPELSGMLHYGDHPEYIAVMFTCVAIDAFQSLPFAWLRFQQRPLKFAAIKLTFIILNISLNLIYFLVIPALYAHPQTQGWVSGFYHGHVDVAYIFYINLASTALVTLFLRGELRGFRYTFDLSLARQMWHYAWPILALGVAGILNTTVDRILFPFISTLDPHASNVALGIYGACAKIAMIMMLITQAFKYAYEPFVFNKSQDRDSKATYAAAMKYFLIFNFFAFLLVIGYLDIIKYVIAPSYWQGLRVIPIVMTSGILLGVFFNLSVWYKITDKTIYGMWFSLAGCVVLVTVNVLFVPHYGYMACAWGGVAGYGVASLLSYLYGQRYNPIPYPLRSIGVYVLLTALFATIMLSLPTSLSVGVRLAVNTLLVLLFLSHIIYHDLPLRAWPIIGKYFRKSR